jgi:hypothetical protein
VVRRPGATSLTILGFSKSTSTAKFWRSVAFGHSLGGLELATIWDEARLSTRFRAKLALFSI